MLLMTTHALAGTYSVSPDGDDAGNGASAPWRTIQHAVNSIPAGENTIELFPGTYTEGQSLDLSRISSSKLTIKSRDPKNPAIITSSGSNCVILVSGKMNGGALRFQDVNLARSNAAALVSVDVQELGLSFDRCSLSGSASLLDTTAPASGVKIKFQECSLASSRSGLRIWASSEIIFSKCSLAWDNASFVQGLARSNAFGRLVFEECALKGSPTASFLAAGNPAVYNVDLFQVSGCTGTCGRLSWEQGGIRQWMVENNNIRWTYTGTVPVGAGIEVRNGQAKPVVNPAPYEKIAIRHNIFHFPDGSTHPIFLGKGADHAEFAGNTLICPNAGKYGVVVKSDHNLFEFNTIYGGRNAFYLAGASHNQLRHNTIYSYQRPALLIDANQERDIAPAGTYGQSYSNEVTANILVAAGPAFMHDAASNDNSRAWNTVCDGNIYWNKSGKAVANVNGVMCQQTNGIAAVQAAWAQYGKAGTMRANDRGSLIANPRLSNPPADFSLQPGSPAMNFGGENNLNAGAWQGSSSGAENRRVNRTGNHREGE